MPSCVYLPSYNVALLCEQKVVHRFDYTSNLRYLRIWFNRTEARLRMGPDPDSVEASWNNHKKLELHRGTTPHPTTLSIVLDQYTSHHCEFPEKQ